MTSSFTFEPKIVGFLCNWCCYAGADLAGVSRFQHPPNMRVIRLMCSGRIDPAFIIRAFSDGADGVFMGGCWLGECHYVTEGNYDALSVMHLGRKLLKLAGVSPERLRLEWVSASEGVRFAEVMTDFTGKLKELGPLGRDEGMDEKELKFNLEAAGSLVPYLKLVEREKLRVRFRTEEEYDEYFNGDEFGRLFRELIEEKLATSKIMLLLRQRPLTAGEISERLGLSPSEVSRHMVSSSRQGLVRYDMSSKRYVPARGGEAGMHARARTTRG